MQGKNVRHIFNQPLRKIQERSEDKFKNGLPKGKKTKLVISVSICKAPFLQTEYLNDFLICIGLHQKKTLVVLYGKKVRLFPHLDTVKIQKNKTEKPSSLQAPQSFKIAFQSVPIRP